MLCSFSSGFLGSGTQISTLPSISRTDLVDNTLYSVIPILISRFILNLRQVAYGEIAIDINITTRLLPFSTSEPRFRHEASVLGNLGGSLSHSFGRYVDDDDTEPPSHGLEISEERRSDVARD